jgi:hypothetical protein
MLSKVTTWHHSVILNAFAQFHANLLNSTPIIFALPRTSGTTPGS